MKIKIFLISLSLLLLIATNSHSQSEYLKNGTSGVGFTVSRLSNSYSNGMGGTFGFSILGRIDIGASYSKIKNRDNHSFYIGSYFYKNDENPLLLGFQGSINNNTKSLALISGLKTPPLNTFGANFNFGYGVIHGESTYRFFLSSFSLFVRSQYIVFLLGNSIVSTKYRSTSSIGFGLLFSFSDNKSNNKSWNKDKKVREKEKKEKKKKKKKRHYYDN